MAVAMTALKMTARARCGQARPMRDTPPHRFTRASRKCLLMETMGMVPDASRAVPPHQGPEGQSRSIVEN